MQASGLSDVWRVELLQYSWKSARKNARFTLSLPGYRPCYNEGGLRCRQDLSQGSIQDPREDGVQRNKRPTVGTEKLANISADRLADLLSTFSGLRRDGQQLIQQLRTSLHEMRALRTQLQEVRRRTPAGGNGTSSRSAYLQKRYGLTSREVEVAMLLAQGRSNTAVAAALHISSHTARHHTQRILAKLGVHSRAEAGAKIRG
jgi:DNA-binding CsgD family transcriptional regulator